MSKTRLTALRLPWQHDEMIKLAYPLVAIGAQADRSRVVVGGRDGFAVISFDQSLEKLVAQQYNQRVSTDIVWNPGNDNEVAFTVDNGNIFTYDMATDQRRPLSGHTRTVNCVRYYSQDPRMLISGSQDCTLRIWDTRVEQHVRAISMRAPVRQMTENPRVPGRFALVGEDGHAHVWDIRADKPELSIPCHMGPAYSVLWMPDIDGRTRIATAGRDKSIRLWDLSHTRNSSERPQQDTVIFTRSPVARMCLRPDSAYQIVACMLERDCTVGVWDIRRPFFPSLVFSGHCQPVTDVFWQDDVFVSCSKDGTVIRHALSAAARPAVDAQLNASGLCFDPIGNLAVFNEAAGSVGSVVGSPERGVERGGMDAVALMMPGSGSQQRIEDAMFAHPGNSSLIFWEPSSNSKQPIDRFAYYATNYKFTEMTPGQLCDHNASVAANANEPQLAQMWRMLKDLLQLRRKPIAAPVASAPVLNDPIASENEPPRCGEPSMHLNASLGGELPTRSGADQLVLSSMPALLPEAVSVDNMRDSESEPEEEDVPTFDTVPVRNVDATSTTTTTTTTTTAGKPRVEGPSCTRIVPLARDGGFSMAFWDSSAVLQSLLKIYIEGSDVQLCVTILLCCGSSVFEEYASIEQMQEWVIAYGEILTARKLFTLRALVFYTCPFPEIIAITQESTTVKLVCNVCTKDLASSKGAWVCTARATQHYTNSCSVCRAIVKGLYSWCQGCGHGGHEAHLREWFVKHRTCPTGCGHACLS